MSGAEYRQVERGSDWQIPVDELVADECQRGVKMLLLGSPNNPTGDTIGTSELLRLVEAPCLVVIDEAYFEFSKETALDTALSRENVVILRSFSKWAGLAGLRIGYGIFPEWLVTLLPDSASAVQRQRSGTDCGPGEPSAPGNFDGTGAIGDRRAGALVFRNFCTTIFKAGSQPGQLHTLPGRLAEGRRAVGYAVATRDSSADLRRPARRLHQVLGRPARRG